MRDKGILTLKIYGVMFGLVILGEWIKAPETILPTIALPFAIYFGYRLLKALWVGICDVFGAIFFREQRKKEKEERLRAEKERFEQLEAERKEAERLRKQREEELRLLTSPDQIFGLFTYKYIKVDDKIGVGIVTHNGFDERDVAIPAIIGNHPVIRIGYKAFTNAKIKNVSCPDSVVEIGEEAFYRCKSLKTIELPNALKRIGKYAFAYCDELERVILPDGLVEMDMCAFAYSGIHEIHFPSTLDKIPYGCCSDCTNLTNVCIEYGIKTIGGKAFGGIFKSGNRIKSIVIPESVGVVEHDAFQGCRASIVFKGMHTNGKTKAPGEIGDSTYSIGGGIYYVLPGSAMQRFAREHMHEFKPLSEYEQYASKETKNSLKDATDIDDKPQTAEKKAAKKCDMPVRTKPAFESIGEMFSLRSCSIEGREGAEITSYNGFDERRIEIPESLLGYSIIRIADKAFERLDVEEVQLPNSLIEIGNYAFYECKMLKKINIPSLVRRIESHAFAQCEQLNRIVLPEGIEYLGEYVLAQTGIGKIVFPASLAVIPVGCCQNCLKLTEVTLNDGIQRIKGKAFAQPAFYKGSIVGNALSSLLIPESVALIETDAFLNREGIQLVFLGMKTTVLEEKRMSYECISQRKAVFYGREGSAIQAYARKYRAKYYDLSAYSRHRTESIKKESPVPASSPAPLNDSSIQGSYGGFTFRGCRVGGVLGLEIISCACSATQKRIDIPERIDKLPVLKLGKGLFENSEVEKIVCPESLRVIGDLAFAQSKKLREVNIPESVIEIGKKAFEACSGLGRIVLPKGLKMIGAYAFAYSGIESIIFNSDLEVIPKACCLNCYRLKSVLLAEGIRQIKSYAFAIGAVEDDETNQIAGIMIPESVKLVAYNAFRGRSQTAIAFCGLETKAEENMVSPSTILYVRPGSMIQKYARQYKLRMKPLYEYKGGGTIPAYPKESVVYQNEKNSTKSSHEAKDSLIWDKQKYVLQVAEILKQYVQKQNDWTVEDDLLSLRSAYDRVGLSLPVKQTNLWKRYYEVRNNSLPVNNSFYADQKTPDEEKYSWRDHVEDGWKYGVDPKDYETAEEYTEALNEEKYGWRDHVEDGWEYGVEPQDYETEDEYLEALNEEKYSWRDSVESGWEHGIDPEDYETEDEYMEALNEEKYGWRDWCEDNDHGIDPDDYETEEEYETAIEEATNSEW